MNLAKQQIIFQRSPRIDSKLFEISLKRQLKKVELPELIDELLETITEFSKTDNKQIASNSEKEEDLN